MMIFQKDNLMQKQRLNKLRDLWSKKDMGDTKKSLSNDWFRTMCWC